MQSHGALVGSTWEGLGVVTVVQANRGNVFCGRELFLNVFLSNNGDP
jgi:hypothetical protein